MHQTDQTVTKDSHLVAGAAEVVVSLDDAAAAAGAGAGVAGAGAGAAGFGLRVFWKELFVTPPIPLAHTAPL